MDRSRAGPIGIVSVVVIYIWLAIDGALLATAAATAFDDTFDYLPLLDSLSITLTFGLIVSGLIFFVWMHRAMSVAHDRSEWLTISPGWAVGWWFVPIASLWKPYQAMVEIWQGSAPNDEVASRTSLIGWWWAAWIANSLIGAFQGVAAVSTDSVLAFLALDGLSGAAAAVLLTLIIRRINAMQTGFVDASIFD